MASNYIILMYSDDFILSWWTFYMFGSSLTLLPFWYLMLSSGGEKQQFIELYSKWVFWNDNLWVVFDAYIIGVVYIYHGLRMAQIFAVVLFITQVFF